MSGGSSLLLIVVLFLGFCGFFVLVLGGIIYLVSRSSKSVNRSWGEIAARAGLTLKPAAALTSPELNGTFRGRPARVHTYSTGTEHNRQTYTAVALTVKNAGNASMEVTPSGTLGNVLGRVVKAQDVQIGNPEFDARFVVKSEPPDFAVKFLGSAGVQTRIMALPDGMRIGLEGQSLIYSRRGMEEDAELLMRVLNTLSDLADELEK
jgi:hypothetical protein